MNEAFLSSYPIDESLALYALEYLLHANDLHCDAAAAVLALASIDSDGSIDPNLHQTVLSQTFISRLADETTNHGGRDLHCPPAFIAAKDAYLAAGNRNSGALELNNYVPTPP
jgi:hypothetical protein